ncbi:MAG TPA: glycerophosphodiester phosphodiesterase [Frateuria sp.]|uniref:glycerophosphodiester phosphodiesterase n=1 Tax=Frateuria sp. TaxID=2211372 RepID=UPI002D7F70FB|nr:glycerophosphodiester phosphodiesterase [Frateuria sp.]HET6805139.1 glycerophosphodiester phosphodiesterase [Frateuria sp.]
MSGRPLVIAHRGACAHLPEHTLVAYARAIADGADLIEPDLVITGDSVLVARHENEIGATTDVARHPRFAARRTRKRIDGVPVEGWFCEDFTLAELKTLRTRERLPALRGTAHDGQYPIATLEDIIELLAAESARRGRVIGLIPEIKHGTWFQQQGLAMERRLLDTLDAHACTRSAPVVIQSFELANLRALRACLAGRPNVRLLQLVDEPGAQPWDIAASGGTLRYADLLTPAGLRQVAGWADAIGPDARAILPLDGSGRPGAPTSLVRDAQAAGLAVYAWTFRPENAFLPPALWCGDDPAQRHPRGSVDEIRAHLAAGIDAFFTDDPALGRQVVDGDRPHDQEH